MSDYPTAVRRILAIYIDRGNGFSEKKEKIVCITGLFDYLSTADVKPLLHTPVFATFRIMLLRKIQEFSNDPYLLARRPQYHHLFSVFREMFTYLVQDDSIPCRRSERQKQRAVIRFNKQFTYCSSEKCVGIANALAYWSAIQPNAKPVNIKVKVLPRRSARLMNKV
jgi:hypothetical protein